MGGENCEDDGRESRNQKLRKDKINIVAPGRGSKESVSPPKRRAQKGAGIFTPESLQPGHLHYGPPPPIVPSRSPSRYFHPPLHSFHSNLDSHSRHSTHSTAADFFSPLRLPRRQIRRNVEFGARSVIQVRCAKRCGKSRTDRARLRKKWTQSCRLGKRIGGCWVGSRPLNVRKGGCVGDWGEVEIDWDVRKKSRWKWKSDCSVPGTGFHERANWKWPIWRKSSEGMNQRG